MAEIVIERMRMYLPCEFFERLEVSTSRYVFGLQIPYVGWPRDKKGVQQDETDCNDFVRMLDELLELCVCPLC